MSWVRVYYYCYFADEKRVLEKVRGLPRLYMLPWCKQDLGDFGIPQMLGGSGWKEQVGLQSVEKTAEGKGTATCMHCRQEKIFKGAVCCRMAVM